MDGNRGGYAGGCYELSAGDGADAMVRWRVVEARRPWLNKQRQEERDGVGVGLIFGFLFLFIFCYVF